MRETRFYAKPIRQARGVGRLLLAALVAGCACQTTPYTTVPALDGVPVFDTIPDAPESHGATVVALVNGDLVAAWYAGTRERATDVAIYAARLPAGSSGWTTPQVIADTPNRSDGNPVLYTTQDGALWLYYVVIEGERWTDVQIRRQSSADGGLTWTPSSRWSVPQGWTTRNKPVRTHSGRLVLPLYNHRSGTSLFALSDDEGASWAFTRELVGGQTNSQPTVIQRSDGTLVALLRTEGPPMAILWSESYDDGETWTSPRPTDLPNPNAAIDVVRLNSGAWALVFNESACSRTPLVVALSNDEGLTWPIRAPIEVGVGEFSYPAIVQAPDDVIHVVYTDDRRHISHAQFTEEALRGL